MKDILIINPAIRLTDKPRHIPHGLAILANIIKKKLAVMPNLLDLNALRPDENGIREYFKKTAFDVVLIGGLIPTYKRRIKL